MHFLDWNFSFLLEFHWTVLLGGPVDKDSSLVKVIACCWRRQAITWTIDDPAHWCITVSQSFYGFREQCHYLWKILGFSLPYAVIGRQWVNALWPSYTIWWTRSEQTLAQAMACCLTVSSHCLSQCWLVFCGILLRAISQELLVDFIHNMCS